MDHKVSKDMISSGMTPSGEKTQADLGRTQYGSAPSPSKLMDAYKSMYEHHKKDADGNTIPHEGEELNENLAGLAAKGLQMASRGARQVSKMAAQGSVKARQMQAQGGVKKAVGDKLQSAKKKLALTSGQKEALLGRTTAGKITRGVGALAAANVAGRMASGNDSNKNNRGLVPVKGYSSYDINFGYTPDGDTISEDLFDSLKSALIEQGCDEKNVMKVMSSITPDFINETIQEENLDEAIFTTGAILAAKLAAKALAKKAVVGATKFAMKKGTTAAATKLVGKVGAKKAAAKYIPQAAAKAPGALAKSAVKNPINTAVAGSMVMPQGGGAPQPTPTAVKGAASGKRTAGMRTMDLDLFDVVKGQLLDEGLTEEECNDVMTTLTIDEIKEGLMPTTLKGALVRGAVGATGLTLAKKGLDKAKEKVDDAINKARDNNPIGGNKRPGADKIYFGK